MYMPVGQGVNLIDLYVMGQKYTILYACKFYNLWGKLQEFKYR